MSRRCVVVRTGDGGTAIVCGTAPRPPREGSTPGAGPSMDPRAMRLRELDALERRRPLDAMELWERKTLKKQLAGGA